MMNWSQENWPARVRVVEVGPRDGFQNITEFIPSEDKVAIIKALLETGLEQIELTSFVNPKAVPQMADAGRVVRAVLADPPAGPFRPIALVPNLVGAQAAWEAGLREVTCVISASEKHNQANVRRGIEESLAGLELMVRELPEMKIRLDLATAFGCPWAGRVSEQEVLSLAGRALDRGAREIVLCDTIGVADPLRVNRLCALILAAFPQAPVAVHLHDTRGLGLANTLAALGAGVDTVETSVGGLGGCPFAPGAAGNTATEDLINMLRSMNVDCGLDLEAYLRAAEMVRAKTAGRVTGHMGRAALYSGLTF
jgi:hydroxymethylglutaryl-CoA lyase